MSNPENSGKQFVKGKSGNVGGRPKGYAAFRKSFRGVEDTALIRARLLELIAADGSQSVAAAKLWLEYGWGRAPAAPEDNAALRESGRGLPPGLTAEQLLALARGERP